MQLGCQTDSFFQAIHAIPFCLQPIKEYVKPHNQLRLSEAELEEELACNLTAGNPAAPSNIARYHLKDGAYKVGCCTVCLGSSLWLSTAWPNLPGNWPNLLGRWAREALMAPACHMSG